MRFKAIARAKARPLLVGQQLLSFCYVRVFLGLRPNDLL